jgi:hypothetical protein
MMRTGYDARIDFEQQRRAAHDQVLTSALVEAAGSLVDDLLDRVLLSDARVTSADEGRRLLEADDDLEQVTDRIQRFVGLATPVLRTVARGARFTRVPWVLVASTTASAAVTIRSGLQELRVLASFVAYRLEQATGEPADPALVKKLALELYLRPRSEPDVSDLRLPLVRLVRHWLVRGALGRDTRKAAAKSLEAAERLDAEKILRRQSKSNRRSSSGTPGPQSSTSWHASPE